MCNISDISEGHRCLQAQGLKMYKETTGLVPRLLKLAKQFNCFYLEGSSNGESCLPFIVGSEQVGVVRPKVASILAHYPDVFQVNSGYITLVPSLDGYDKRTKAVDAVLRDCKEKGVFLALRGWRDECYEIKRVFSSESLFKMDRSATCLFGICNYGVTINGYVHDPRLGLCLWLQKRSLTKQTWPGKWDNMVAGGLSVGHGVLETAHKEAEEEASIPPELLKKIISRGSVSFFYESERGVFPNTEFVYDLELPLNFVPTNNDGEVDKFELLPTKELIERLFSPEFKTTSCPVVVDFLIRHGIVTPDNEPQFPQLVELLHVPLQSLYKSSLLKNGHFFCDGF
ncbi:uncharacterized protein [Rhodnius prolixus]